MRFSATLELHGKTATGLEVPAEVVDALGSGRSPAVSVTLRGHTYRTTVASRAGRYLIPVSAEHRAAAGVSAGDDLEVEIELDDQPRTLTVPDEFARALDDAPAAKAFFEGLSRSKQQVFTLSVEGAKTDETRQRRVEKAVSMLREGRTR